jgi:RNA polymerase sigma-70 factor (ECF subfamily)
MGWASIMAAEQAIRAAELVLRVQQGDPAAFAELYEEYAPLVFRFLRRRVDGSDEVVEDLTEDVFLKVYEKLDRYVERGLPFAAWLFRIAHNYLIDYVRTLPRTTPSPLEAAAEVVEPEAVRAYGRVLDRQILEHALARLTPEQRQTIELRFFAGLTVAETATVVGRTEDAVKKLQARGLGQMRKSLTAPMTGRSVVEAVAVA